MRKKQVLFVVMAVMILLPSFLGYADTTKPVEAEKMEGKLTSKDEVVYATLNANGDLDEIYVVNTLDVAEAGEILDYGEYNSVKNLTDLSKLLLEDETVRINAPEGKFYYQGNMKKESTLPWDITVSYLLDGNETAPSELAGKTGHVEINIDTTAHMDVDSVFYDNYLLQVSLMLPNTYENIEASSGMAANAGENKQITFTVMPGQEERLTVEADVKDFEFQGIEIAAVPSTLPINTSEMDNMTDDMSSLTNAIGELNNGVADLKSGVSQLNTGAASLRDASVQYNKGMNEMDGASSEIVDASRSIREALLTINNSLSDNPTERDLTKLNQLPDGLTQLGNGLTETADGLAALRENYSLSYRALDKSINAIPALSEEEVTGLSKSGADANVLAKVLAAYDAIETVKETFSRVKKTFDAVDPSLNQANIALKGMSGKLTAIANDLSGSLEEMNVNQLGELQKGLAALAANYGEFHSGLIGYTEGVKELSASYNKLHSGIVGLSTGTGEFEEGIGELHNGTDELYQETKDLPNQIQEEINQMIQEYDKSDFKPVSFVSSKNEKVYSVQFVIKTEGIKPEEQETKNEQPVKEKGFWDLLLELFK